MSQENAARLATEWWSEKLMAGDHDKFKAALYPLIMIDLKYRGRCHLDCEDDPRGHLLTAVRAAGLQCSGSSFSAIGILPEKHTLDVYTDRLEPKEGYGLWLTAIPVPE